MKRGMIGALVLALLLLGNLPVLAFDALPPGPGGAGEYDPGGGGRGDGDPDDFPIVAGANRSALLDRVIGKNGADSVYVQLLLAWWGIVPL